MAAVSTSSPAQPICRRTIVTARGFRSKLWRKSEADPDNAAAVKEMLNSFLRALAAHDDVVQAGRPQEAAERLARETDRILNERALAAAVKSSLAKGYAPLDFFRR